MTLLTGMELGDSSVDGQQKVFLDSKVMAFNKPLFIVVIKQRLFDLVNSFFIQK